MAQQKYTLGRGRLYFAPFKTDTQTPIGERYLGNTPAFALTIDAENLDHFNSDAGIREKDDSVAIQVNRKGTLTTDNIDLKNVALFFFGEHDTLTTEAAVGSTETLTDVEPGLEYQLGTTDDTPSGVRKVSNVVVEMGATTFVVDTDYTVDADLGRIAIVEGGAILLNDDLDITYDVAASTRERVISGTEPVEGALRFVAYNPKGADTDYFMPWVKITPNGDYALKGEEWQAIPFNVEVLKKTTVPAILADGRAFTA